MLFFAGHKNGGPTIFDLPILEARSEWVLVHFFRTPRTLHQAKQCLFCLEGGGSTFNIRCGPKIAGNHETMYLQVSTIDAQSSMFWLDCLCSNHSQL